jgi:hypothetical protein
LFAIGSNLGVAAAGSLSGVMSKGIETSTARRGMARRKSGRFRMMDSPICPTCDRPIRLEEPVYFWPDRRTMEHLWCHVRWLDITAEVEASANPAYGPMS